MSTASVATAPAQDDRNPPRFGEIGKPLAASRSGRPSCRRPFGERRPRRLPSRRSSTSRPRTSRRRQRDEHDPGV
jgi:hypothetical protein